MSAAAVPIAEVAVLLSSALGEDKSHELVSTAARSLGISKTSFTGDEIHAIFDRLVKAEGLAGVVARFAVSRGDVDRLAARAPGPGSPVAGRAPLVSPDAMPTPLRPAPLHVDLMPLIAPALGAEKARDAIGAAAARRGIDATAGLTHGAALAVLDEMACVEGIVGVVARFAKARFLLLPS